MKKIIVIMLAVLLACGAASVGSFAAGEVMGDVDMNGKVEINDAVTVLKAANGQVSLGSGQNVLADVTYDGKVDTQDALRILLYTNGDVNDRQKLGSDEGNIIIS